MRKNAVQRPADESAGAHHASSLRDSALARFGPVTDKTTPCSAEIARENRRRQALSAGSHDRETRADDVEQSCSRSNFP